MGSGARRQQLRQARLSTRDAPTHTSAMPRERGAGAHRQGKAQTGETQPTCTDTLTPDTQAQRKRHRWTPGWRPHAETLRTETKTNTHTDADTDGPRRGKDRQPTHTHTSKGETQVASRTHAVTNTKHGDTPRQPENLSSHTHTHTHTATGITFPRATPPLSRARTFFSRTCRTSARLTSRLPQENDWRAPQPPPHCACAHLQTTLPRSPLFTAVVANAPASA